MSRECFDLRSHILESKPTPYVPSGCGLWPQPLRECSVVGDGGEVVRW